jgi:hypothetical protein
MLRLRCVLTQFNLVKVLIAEFLEISFMLFWSPLYVQFRSK